MHLRYPVGLKQKKNFLTKFIAQNDRQWLQKIEKMFFVRMRPKRM